MTRWDDVVVLVLALALLLIAIPLCTMALLRPY